MSTIHPNKALNDLLKFIRNNLELAKTYQTLFQSTLEYIQFLTNDRTKAIKIHSTIQKIICHTPHYIPPHLTQYTSLCHFHEIYCQLAEAIENDRSTQWGDNIYPTSYRREYARRKQTYAFHMNSAWKKVQHTLTVNDIQHCWSLD